MLSLPIAFQGLLLAASAYAGWSDAWHRRIPNWLCAITAICGLAMAFLAGDLQTLGSHALHAAIALVIGMLLFRLGAWGGGDAKFYAAVATWFALGKAALLLLTVALCGLVLLIVWFACRRAMGKPVARRATQPGDGLPYGIAIGLGAILTQYTIFYG